jgi:hypothetical protein
MIIILFLLCLTAFVSAGCGGGGGGGGGTSDTVTGTVMDSLNSDTVVQGATVTIGGITATTRTVNNATTTNPVGSFQMNNVPYGSHIATVVLPSGGGTQSIAFAPSVTSGANASISLYVNIGQISGRIFQSNGQPASSAFITISTTGDTFQTNSDGTFLATLIPAGSTTLFAVEGTASFQETVTVNYGNNIIPNITLQDDPNPNPPGAPYTLTGQVTVTDVGTPSGTTVLLDRNGVQIESTLTDSNGMYYFYVPIGTYTVTAVRNGFQTITSGTINLTNASQPITTNLTMISQ